MKSSKEQNTTIPINIDLYSIDSEVSYTYTPRSVGVIDENGREEVLEENVSIYSIKAKGIELMPLIDKETIAQMEEDILDRIS
jgi:hypothetical protein